MESSKSKLVKCPLSGLWTDGGDLCKDCATITEEAVAASDSWCADAPPDPQKKCFGQNLDLSCKCLCNSMTDESRQECPTTHGMHAEEDRGGPLLFKIMMDKLLIDTREAADDLVTSLTAHSLQKEQGENVPSFHGQGECCGNTPAAHEGPSDQATHVHPPT